MEIIYAYAILPLLIFLARVIDVSLGTIRIIFISKGFKSLSLIIGFVEVLIWLAAINQIWSHLNNIWLYIAYAGGFAAGNYIGIWLDEKICLGDAMINIITRKNPKNLIQELRKNKYHMTIIDGKSGTKETGVKIIFSVVKRKELKNVLKIIKETNPNAFFTVEDIRSVRKNGYLITPHRRSFNKKPK